MLLYTYYYFIILFLYIIFICYFIYYIVYLFMRMLAIIDNYTSQSVYQGLIMKPNSVHVGWKWEFWILKSISVSSLAWNIFLYPFTNYVRVYNHLIFCQIRGGFLAAENFMFIFLFSQKCFFLDSVGCAPRRFYASFFGFN
jgi:hypothetical protein